MKSIKLAITGLFAVATMAMARPEVTCQSIDATFRPFYMVEIQLFDVTHPGFYGVTIIKTIDLAGTKQKVMRREGQGKITSKGFFVDFIDQSGKIEGKALSNGLLKGELLLGNKREELSCQLN